MYHVYSRRLYVYNTVDGMLNHHCAVCARERCRISPPCFVAECHMRRLNQGYVLFRCILCCLLFLVVFNLRIYRLLSCLAFSSVIQREWHRIF